MIKLIIDKETDEIIRRYYMPSMFDKIRPKENEYSIITNEELDINEAYKYDKDKQMLVKLDDIHL